MSDEMGESAEVAETSEATESADISGGEAGLENGSVGSEEIQSEGESTYTLPEFNFGEWNGDPVSLPEVYRPIHSTISGRVQEEVTSLRESLKQDRELYQALLEGEDVGGQARAQLAENQKELDSLRGGQEKWQKQKEAYESRLGGI